MPRIQEAVLEFIPGQNGVNSPGQGNPIPRNPFKRLMAVWQAGGTKSLASTLGLLVFNLWLLLKINLFKRL